MRTDIRIFLTLLAALLPSAGLAAQENPLTELRQTLASKRLSASYRYDVDGKIPLNGIGTAILQGKCFRISGGGMEIICDSENIYTVDSQAREVYIEKAEETGGWISSPEKFLGQVEELKYGKSSLSGSVKNPSDGSTLYFELSDIRSAPYSEDAAEFSFDVSGLPAGWIVTDLR